jgi:hypothetical protein
MKKICIPFIMAILALLPISRVQAEEYTLKAGKEIKANYAGAEETDYNYFKFTPSKSGFAEIKVKTSDGSNLQFDICDSNKEEIAKNIVVKNKKSVFHKVKKGATYYVKVKGSEGATHTISYKMNTTSTLTYAKKYNFTFTNASFCSASDAILFKVKARDSGNLHFMCNTDSNVNVQYLNSKKKAVSATALVKGHGLTGIGEKKNGIYYIKLWKPENSIEGTTSIQEMNYQIDAVYYSDNSSQKKAKVLTINKSAETLVPAGNKTTTWYKINLTKEQKLTLTFESHLLQNNGKGLKFTLYAVNNGKSQSITKNTDPLVDEVTVTYNKKKYKMRYPKTTIKTGKLPAGVYYLKIVSSTKTTSGSYKISWK